MLEFWKLSQISHALFRKTFYMKKFQQITFAGKQNGENLSWKIYLDISSHTFSYRNSDST